MLWFYYTHNKKHTVISNHWTITATEDTERNCETKLFCTRRWKAPSELTMQQEAEEVWKTMGLSTRYRQSKSQWRTKRYRWMESYDNSIKPTIRRVQSRNRCGTLLMWMWRRPRLTWYLHRLQQSSGPGTWQSSSVVHFQGLVNSLLHCGWQRNTLDLFFFGFFEAKSNQAFLDNGLSIGVQREYSTAGKSLLDVLLAQ